MQTEEIEEKSDSEACEIVNQVNNVEWNSEGDPLYSHDQMISAIIKASEEKDKQITILTTERELLRQTATDALATIKKMQMNLQSAEQEKKEKTELMREIDFELMMMEDYTHGEEGKTITRLRKKIQQSI